MAQPETKVPLWAIGWIVALICGVAPLFATPLPPLVDLPQHLHLISVLHRLDDTSTLFPEVMARRPVFTPYLGYYYTVSALHWLMPLEWANRLFLSAYVAGLPLALGFLLHRLRRPTWPALLALPFAYGDSLAWGFVNYCAALPLAFAVCGCFVAAIDAPSHRQRWAVGAGLLLLGVLAFHVQVFLWLSVSLPFLLATTPAPAEGKGLKGWAMARRYALFCVAPASALFLLWAGSRLSAPADIAYGQPWKAWGPTFSPQNLAWKPLAENLTDLTQKLSGLTPDGSDGQAVTLAFIAAAIAAIAAAVLGERRAAFGAGLVIAGACAAAWLFRTPLMAAIDARPPLAAALLAPMPFLLAKAMRRPLADVRMVGLCLIAFALLLSLPFDIRGYMYYLNTRYVHLVAALAVAAVPALPKPWAERAVALGVALAVVTALPLFKAFSGFGQESAALLKLAQAAPSKGKIMGLIYNSGSQSVPLPVHLHAAATVARVVGGVPNFSFALTPHSPLMYRGEAPPTFPSEWRPHELDWERHGKAYDAFVIRGGPPEAIPVLRDHLNELYVAAQEGDFYLVRKR
jgi:hypothetical protein